MMSAPTRQGEGWKLQHDVLVIINNGLARATVRVIVECPSSPQLGDFEKNSGGKIGYYSCTVVVFAPASEGLAFENNFGNPTGIQ